MTKSKKTRKEDKMVGGMMETMKSMMGKRIRDVSRFKENLPYQRAIPTELYSA